MAIMTNKVNFSVIPFPPIQFSGDIAQLAQLLADHLDGTLDQTVFTGQYLGSDPGDQDIGLWFDGTFWKYFNSTLGKYVPTNVIVGHYDGTTLWQAGFVNNNTKNTLLTLPSDSGTLALQEGEGPGGGPGTGTGAGNSIPIDSTQPKSLYVVMSGDTTIVDSGGITDGKSMDLWLETPPGHGTAIALTVPDQWRKSVSALSTTDSTHRSVSHFKIFGLGGEVFIEKLGTFTIETAGGGSSTTGGSDTTPPTFSRAYTSAGNIIAEFDELIIGPTTSNWVVKKGGVTQTIASMIVSGNKVTIYLAVDVSPADAATVQMLASSGVTDLAGNAATPFGPVSVEAVS